MTDDELLLHYIGVAETISDMFNPMIETVVLDYRTSNPAIKAIFNNKLTGRKEGHPTSDLGRLRIQGKVPDKLVNYPNKGAQGQVLKSTSLAIRNAKKDLIGVLSIHWDISMFNQLSQFLDLIVATKENAILKDKENFFYEESLSDIQKMIEKMILENGFNKNRLIKKQREFIMTELLKKKVFVQKKAISTIAFEINVSRQWIYQWLKKNKEKELM